MSRAKKNKDKTTRLIRATERFRHLVNQYRSVGQMMVKARSEFLEADAEEKAQLALKHTDDRVIQEAALTAAVELEKWKKLSGEVREIPENVLTIEEQKEIAQIVENAPSLKEIEEKLNAEAEQS